MHTVASFTLAALAMAAHVQCACTNVTRSEDNTLQAFCTNDATGIEFVYMDWQQHLEKSMTVPEAQMPAAMYDAYKSGMRNSTDVSSDFREDLSWQPCKEKVSGFCSRHHTIHFTGSLAGFGSLFLGIYNTIESGKRADQKPRSVCTNYDNEGTVCVSWAADYANKMSTDQIKRIVNECTNTCQKNKQSYEARVVTDSTTQYFCTSNRAKHCTADKSIKQC